MHIDQQLILQMVKTALAEDIGNGDLSANIIPENQQNEAILIVKETATLCGCQWFETAFCEMDPDLNIQWHYQDGDTIHDQETICTITANTRALLSGERTAINFLQLLSATATQTKKYVNLLSGYQTKILDTRKTIPNLRLAQKYAVYCGHGNNHRLGLYDATLIKENHIHAAGSISNAYQQAKQQQAPIIIEVTNLSELQQALDTGVEHILLDNFNHDTLKQAVKLNQGQAKLEASGNINEHNLIKIAQTGVDYISIGALTKNITAIDFSLKLIG